MKQSSKRQVPSVPPCKLNDDALESIRGGAELAPDPTKASRIDPQIAIGAVSVA